MHCCPALLSRSSVKWARVVRTPKSPAVGTGPGGGSSPGARGPGEEVTSQSAGPAFSRFSTKAAPAPLIKASLREPPPGSRCSSAPSAQRPPSPSPGVWRPVMERHQEISAGQRRLMAVNCLRFRVTDRGIQHSLNLFPAPLAPLISQRARWHGSTREGAQTLCGREPVPFRTSPRQSQTRSSKSGAPSLRLEGPGTLDPGAPLKGKGYQSLGAN